MEEVKVSVIVPIYNVEKYLKRCVDSIINQTYKNLEIILVNDGSPDNCPQMCDEFAKQDSRIKVVHKPNGGISSARNAGLKMVTGEYFCFVDSDDWLHKQNVEALMFAVNKHKSDLTVADFLIAYDDETYEEQEITSFECECNENKFKYYAKYLTSPWNKLYKTATFKDLHYPDGRVYEDAHVAPWLFETAEKISLVKNKLYYYFQRRNSIMGSLKQKFFESYIYEMYENQIKTNQFIDIKKHALMCMLTCYTHDRFIALMFKNKQKANEFKNKIKETKRKHIKLYRMNSFKNKTSYYKAKLKILLYKFGMFRK